MTRTGLIRQRTSPPVAVRLPTQSRHPYSTPLSSPSLSIHSPVRPYTCFTFCTPPPHHNRHSHSVWPQSFRTPHATCPCKTASAPPYSTTDPHRPPPPLHRPEPSLLLHDSLRREGRRTIPARKRFEQLLCLPLALASGMVPEQALRKLPAARVGIWSPFIAQEAQAS